MKHTTYFLSITHALIITTCIAMEIKNKPDIITELTCVKKAERAFFLTNDRAIINGQNGCSIISVTTNKEIIKIKDRQGYRLAIHPHGKIFALVHDKTITIYSAITGTPEWSTTDDYLAYNPVFSPYDTTLFVIQSCLPGYAIAKYNYITNESTKYNYQYFPLTIFNPAQKEICIKHSEDIMVHQDIEFPYTKKFPIECTLCSFLQYSPNGTFLAMGNQMSITTIDLIDNKQIFYLKTQKSNKYSEYFTDIRFYSNSILAVTSAICYHSLDQGDTCFYYWNIQTDQSIHIDTIHTSALSHFSFSPDKEKIIYILNGQCFIAPIPWQVPYEPDAKEKFSHLLLLLQNFNLDSSIALPRELVTELGFTLLELFKR